MQTVPVTGCALWQASGTKKREVMLPPLRGLASRPILGTTIFETSPMPINTPALRRIASMRLNSSLSASSSAAFSWPVLPNASARISTIGIATSTQLTSTPSITSSGLPVGSNLPVTAPIALLKLILTGAALPGTPSIAASPA